jgi:hypothetical protein
MPNRTTVAMSSSGAKGLARVALVVCLACFGLAQSADAEVRVSGTANAVNVETQGATLDETLRALQSSFKFRYQGAALPDPISGTYSGSLRSVIARLLAGHDYILHTSSGELIVTLVGKNAANAATTANAPENAPPRRFLHGGAAAVTPGAADGKDCKAVINGQEVAVEC